MALVLLTDKQLDEIANNIELDPGKKGAIVGTVDTNGAKVALVYNFDVEGNFKAEAAFQHEWTGENEAGFKVLAQW